MLANIFFHGCLYALAVHAAKSTSSKSTSHRSSTSHSVSFSEATVPTGSYISYSTQITLVETGTFGTMTFVSTSIGSRNATSSSTSQVSVKKTTHSVTGLTGTKRITPTMTASNASTTTSATSSANLTSSVIPIPTNTRPCNGYAELCYRQFSNITYVMAHNSPFVSRSSLSANQAFDVTVQLNDGIRGLQTQTHMVNGTLYNCHTSCEIFEAGTLTSYLTEVTTWVRAHPYDVITIIIENGDYVNVDKFLDPITDSGIMQFVYQPDKIPMHLEDWPTLSNMILSGQRVVLFLDYQANQTAVPWLMDEFSNVWETPFDPTNRSFPCNVQRPPNLNAADAKSRMYLTNHNLNTEINILSFSLSVPSTPLLNVTNAPAYLGFGSLGLGAETCYNTWDRPPNYLNVDYYNEGNFNGSVFQVAADWNNVTYNNASCCGLMSTKSGATQMKTGAKREIFAVIALTVLTSCFLI